MAIANILGLFIFLFFLWRTLKEDYQYEKIFNLAFFVLFGFVAGFMVSKYILGNYWLWLSLSGILVGFGIAIKILRMKFYDTFEGLVIGLLPWISIIYLIDVIRNSSLSSFILFWASLICIALFFFFKSYYRTFTWYKSGRVGFAGVLTASLFFLVRATTNHEPYLSGAVTLVLFLLLYKLSINKND